MNATDNPTTLAHLQPSRCAVGFSFINHNLLLALDLFAGLTLAALCGLLYLPGDLSGWPAYALVSPSDREILLCNIILALTLREPLLTKVVSFGDWSRLIRILLIRCATMLAAIAVLEFTTKISDQIVWLRLLCWTSCFLAWFCVSRVILLYNNDLEKRTVSQVDGGAAGSIDVAGQLAIRLGANAAVIAILDDQVADADDEPVSDVMTDLVEFAGNGDLDAIVVAFERSAIPGTPPAFRHSDCVPLHENGSGEVLGSTPARRPMRAVGELPLSVGIDRPMQYHDLLLKSIIDIAGTLILLCLLSPVGIIVSLAIMIDSPGPIIFRQQRSGWGGQLFTIFKFRSMHHTADAACHQTLRNDPRCTRVGAILRRTSLDELPQLWNVLRGEMSLVGPRPHADMLHIFDQAGCRLVAEYAQRHRVKPGLTGWAQIHGSRGAISTTEEMRTRIEYDLHYIDHWSAWLDMYILMLTPLAVLRGRNAF